MGIRRAEQLDTSGNWRIPPAIMRAASRVLNGMEEYGFGRTAELEAIVKRLLNDRRMKGIWDRLLPPGRKASFRYAARLEALNPFTQSLKFKVKRIRFLREVGDDNSALEAEILAATIARLRDDERDAALRISGWSALERQEQACELYFFAAFSAAALGVDTFTEAAIESVNEWLHAQARSIDDVSVIASLISNYDVSELETVSSMFRRTAVDVLSWKESPLLVDRSGPDDTLRAFAISMGSAGQDCFGQPLYGTIADVANVALDREDVAGPQIREILRSLRR